MNWLNGKKTMIAATLNAVLVWVAANDMMTPPTVTMLATILTIWTGVAVGHKVVKGGK